MPRRVDSAKRSEIDIILQSWGFSETFDSMARPLLQYPSAVAALVLRFNADMAAKCGLRFFAKNPICALLVEVHAGWHGMFRKKGVAMSYDYLAKKMYDAAIIENMNKIRHFILGRIEWDDAQNEIEAFGAAFDALTPEKLGAIIVGQMFFNASEKNNLAFEFADAIQTYAKKNAREVSDSANVCKLLEEAGKSLSSGRDVSDLTEDSKNLLLDFLQTSMSSLAGRGEACEFGASLNVMGL